MGALLGQVPSPLGQTWGVGSLQAGSGPFTSLSARDASSGGWFQLWLFQGGFLLVGLRGEGAALLLFLLV